MKIRVWTSIFETILTWYFWYIWKFCNWLCFIFHKTRNYKTVHLLQVKHTRHYVLTLKRTFLTSKHTFLASKHTFLATKCMFLASKHNISFAIIFVTVLQNVIAVSWNFPKTKHPISFDCFDNFETARYKNYKTRNWPPFARP